jgi:hypothetical protein
MKTPSHKPLSLYPRRKPDGPLPAKRAKDDEKQAEIDDRFKHLDQDIEAAQHKADDATVSHGILGVGGSGVKKASS